MSWGMWWLEDALWLEVGDEEMAELGPGYGMDWLGHHFLVLRAEPVPLDRGAGDHSAVDGNGQSGGDGRRADGCEDLDGKG